jgi:hypothetical protein
MICGASARARLLGALVLLSGLVATACGSGGSKGQLGEPTIITTSTSTTVAPTTTAVPGKPAPLTGVPAADPAVFARPALAVKIDNIDAGGCESARPQFGLSHADVVYEILVEGITRFMAVFQSDIPETVGPVRSARSSDVDLLAGLGSPLFAWSGNNDNVAADLGKIRGRFVDVGHSSGAGGSFYRTKDRCAPHNLLVNPVDLYDYAKDKKGGVPAPVFTYRAKGAALPGTARPVAGVRLTTGQDVTFTWNAATNRWDRAQKGSPHTVVDGSKETLLSATNVVVPEVVYAESSTPGSPLAVTVGKGRVSVFVQGKVITGTWERKANTDPWTFLDEAGTAITLDPGTTWVQLSMRGKVEALDAVGAARADGR